MNHLFTALSLSTLFVFGCQNQESSNAQRSGTASAPRASTNGTAQMIDSLNAVYNRTNFRTHPYESAQKVELIAKELSGIQPSGNQVMEYAYELLKAGKSKEAATILEQIPQKASAFKEVNEKSKSFYEFLAITYMRIGEQDNCIMNHTGESCIYPFRGQGIHTQKEGSRAAIGVYEKILDKFPDDERSRYLLNLAYMTLGEYPQKVPVQWRLDPKTLKSDYPLPHFANIAPNLGFEENNLAGGCIADDFDNDGFIDLMISSWGLKDKVRFFKNTGSGFTERTDQAGLKGLTGGLNMIQTDYNNDGYVDFLILRGAWKPLTEFGIPPSSLVKNNGDGTFTDVTIAAGLYRQRPTQTAVWFDFDRDGWLDLFIGAESVEGHNHYFSEFYRNDGNGTFTEMPESAGLKFEGFVKGVSSSDVNNDGLDDLYVSVMNGANKLFINKGGTAPADWRFEEVGAQAAVQEPRLSFPTWFFDFNNDGFEDIFVGAFDSGTFLNGANSFASLRTDVHNPRLYQNNGNGTFTEQSNRMHLDKPLQVMGSNFGDLDNDGFPDMYLGTGDPDFRSIFPNKMYRNNAGKEFQDVTTAGGFGNIQKGHAVAFADFDNDGDQDIYEVIGGAYSGDIFQDAFFQNPGNKNNWVTIVLEGTTSNRAAIGARLKLTVKGADGKTRTIFDRVSSGGSFGGNSLQQEIGLGNAAAIEKLEINWPNKENKYIDYGKIEPKQRVKIKEGSMEVQKMSLTPVVFSKEAQPHQHHM